MTAPESRIALWKQADAILARSLELPGAERRPYVKRACAEDAELRSIVETLLQWAENEDPFLTHGRALAGPIGRELAADAAVPSQSEPDRVGHELGHYEIVRSLGRGGMGEVYEALDTKLQRRVAVKILPAGFAESGERLRRFAREARLLAHLNHPNIAQIYGLEDAGATHALVMELVEGPTLAERLEPGPLPLEETLVVACQVAEALEEAHEKGIVHRDLKPQNIKAPVGSKTKVLDFGLAKAMDPDGVLSKSADEMAQSPTATFDATREGTILGTAAYMAPEQARGGAIDKRVDIWAFGVILYEALTGERLFAEDGVVETLSAVLHREIDLGRLPPGTPARLRELLRRCLEHDPRQRLRDIGEARIALESIAAHGGDDPATGAPPSPRPSRLRLGLAVAATGLAAGALLGALLAGWQRAPAATEPVQVRTLTYSGSDSDPSASPDGKMIAFTSRRGGTARIWIQQLAGGGEAPLTDGSDTLPRFSPDGASVLFVRDLGATQALYRIALIGGEPRRLVDGVSEGDWSPDGSRVVFTRTSATQTEGSQLGIFDLASGEERILVELGSARVHSPRWSPDGRTIAFTTGHWSDTDWRIQQVDVDSGRVTPIPPGQPGIAMGGLAWSGTGRELFYIQSPSMMGEVIGAASRVVRRDVHTGESQTILWTDGLSRIVASSVAISHTDVLAAGRLLVGQRVWRQSLREVDPDGEGASSGTRVLAQGSAVDRQPVYSPDGTLVLISSGRGGNLDLWTIDRANGAIRRITEDPAQDWDPAYTPDGRHILLSSERATGHLEIWMANADGSGARQVTRDGVSAQNPTATADGRWIVYWSGNPEKLGVWKIRPDGSEATLLVAGNFALTEVSPDGRYVLYVAQDPINRRNTIRVAEVESGRIVPFTIEMRYSLGAPEIIWGRFRWSPDGGGIYYVGEDERGLSGVFYQQFAPGRDTTATRRPVAGFSTEYVTESFAVSPDGSRLTLSIGQESASILVADNVPGALPPARDPGGRGSESSAS